MLMLCFGATSNIVFFLQMEILSYVNLGHKPLNKTMKQDRSSFLFLIASLEPLANKWIKKKENLFPDCFSQSYAFEFQFIYKLVYNAKTIQQNSKPQ